MSMRLMTEEQLDNACKLAITMQKVSISSAIDMADVSKEAGYALEDAMVQVAEQTVDTIQMLLKEEDG